MKSFYSVLIWSVLLLCILLVFGCGPLKNSVADASNDFTFFVGSDLHFGKNDSVALVNREMANDMMSLPGTRYPGYQDIVQRPSWVSFTGDLTEKGEIEEWKEFTGMFGLNGQDEFPFRVYEGFGNHDGPMIGDAQSVVRNGIKTRNIKREGITKFSKDSLHYSWDEGGVHFVNLNSYPGNKWDSKCDWCHYFKADFKEPANSLEFLELDLASSVGDSRKPIILFSHYGFDDWGKNWWTEAEMDAFYNVIEKYNVVAIFHGHTHEVQHYYWKDIPVWCVGATQHSNHLGEYFVVRIKNKKILVNERNNKQWGRSFMTP